MPQAERDALLLHSWAGFTAREVADIVGTTTQTAAKRVTRARQRFAAVYLELAGEPHALLLPNTSGMSTYDDEGKRT
jgi:DNA-directed RNA polymerase specialized sigma24 family protein